MTTYAIKLDSPERAQQIEQILNADVEGGVYAEASGSEVLLTVSPIVAAIGGAIAWMSLAVIRCYDRLAGERVSYRHKPTV